MGKNTDVRVTSVSLHFLEVKTRVPLKFGPETLTEVTCARVRLRVEDRQGKSADGWGETPLSVQWVWPGALPYAARLKRLKSLCLRLAGAWAAFPGAGHPLELGSDFTAHQLPALHERHGGKDMPRLAALVCSSPFDLALHDAYGNLLGRPTYET